MERAVKIGWVLSMDRTNAATRLQGYLIHEWLVRHGVASEIVAIHAQQITSPSHPQFRRITRQLRQGAFTHVVFESPEWPTFKLAMVWKQWGGIAICVRCDNVSGLYDDFFDATILPTETLADSLQVQRRKIIPDSVEVPLGLFKTRYAAGLRIQVVWVGHQSYADYLTSLVAELQKDAAIQSRYAFTLISKGDFATKQWAEDTVFPDILECDIAIIPILQGVWFSTKSSNRLAMLMALGMPVVASRIPSYEALGTHGRNVLFVDDVAGLRAGLLALQDADARATLGTQARLDIGDTYAIEKIGHQWHRAIVDTPNMQRGMPHVSVPNRVLAMLLRLV